MIRKSTKSENQPNSIGDSNVRRTRASEPTVTENRDTHLQNDGRIF